MWFCCTHVLCVRFSWNLHVPEKKAELSPAPKVFFQRNNYLNVTKCCNVCLEKVSLNIRKITTKLFQKSVTNYNWMRLVLQAISSVRVEMDQRYQKSQWLQYISSHYLLVRGTKMASNKYTKLIILKIKICNKTQRGLARVAWCLERWLRSLSV